MFSFIFISPLHALNSIRAAENTIQLWGNIFLISNNLNNKLLYYILSLFYVKCRIYLKYIISIS